MTKNHLRVLCGAILVSATIYACKFRNSSHLKDASFSGEDFTKVKQYLKSYCGECHIDSSEGGFDYAGDLPKLASSKLIVKGKPDSSVLWQRIANKEMPDSGASKFPTPEESEIVKRWIAEGAPVNFGAADRPLISAGQMLRSIAQDLKSLPTQAQPFTRYLDIRHLSNQTSGGAFLLSEDQLDAFRGGLSTLVNSLSWQPQIASLVAVPNTGGTVLRLDLRNYITTANDLARNGIGGLETSTREWSYAEGYGLTRSAWDEIGKRDTYHVDYTGKTAEFIRQTTVSNFPTIRGDLFVFIAGRSHKPADPETFKFLYYRILGIKPNFEQFNQAIFKGRKISNMLVAGDTKIMRSGFASSGVSDHNRLIERHVIPGYRSPINSESFYWLSYDFGGSSGQQHLESKPLGPIDAFGNLNGGRRVFSHDGGEVIFSLPNGLHGYLLFTSKGNLLDQAPSNIVRYLDGKHSTVFNGVSCMDCHKKGMIEKPDTIYQHIQENRDEFTAEELEVARHLYLGQPDVLTSVFKSDSKSYLVSKAKSTLVSGVQTKADGANVSDLHASAVSDLFDYFNRDVTISMAASEVDLDEVAFTSVLKQNSNLKQILASFYSESGKVVKRETFRDFFPQIVKELRLSEIREAAGQALCSGCTAICSYSVVSPQGNSVGNPFVGRSKESVEKADEEAFGLCDAKLTDSIRKAGFICQRVAACQTTKQ